MCVFAYNEISGTRMHAGFVRAAEWRGIYYYFLKKKMRARVAFVCDARGRERLGFEGANFR